MPPPASDGPHLRERVTAAVQWAPARNGLKYVAHSAARARARVLRARGAMPDPANIFAASCPKAGSQWTKALFHHPIVRAHTGLFTVPQLDYYQRKLRPFPGGTFVPGLYLSYPDYQKIPKPLSHRTVYVFRDPRDILVSGYFSGLQTHREILDVNENRAVLQRLSLDEGLLYALKVGEDHLRAMASWVGVQDENVAAWRLEDIQADPAATVPAILAHCGVELTADELDTVLTETSRDELQRQDLASRKAGDESHYRVRRQGYRELLGPEHYAALEEVVPGLVEQLGYPPA